MKKAALVCFATLALSGCIAESPPPVARYYPPPPRPRPARPAHETSHHAVAAVVPRPRPGEAKTAEAAKPDRVKPLGEGKLTALAVGDYMDGQEKDLRAKLRGSGVIVSRVGDNLVLNIRSDRLFAGDTALSPSGDAIMHTVADSVRRFDSTTLSVNGFTDGAGAPSRDMKLSQQVADLVDRKLVEDGVDPHRVTAKGFGAGDQKESSSKDARNRRIEIDITPRVKT
jgi:outer membrane protein OmpA-like peptidoglycan-associated protein